MNDYVDANNSIVEKATLSSSEDSGSAEISSTSPSSILSETCENLTKEPVEVRLPSPFFPASLVEQAKAGSKIIARELPNTFGLPRIPEEEPCKVVDSQDEGSPDSWVHRDSRLIRLTGRHPFNAETKIGDLYAQGFFTPINLFFVRNHGAVPKINQDMAEKWRLEIHGLCANPVTLSLNDLRMKFRVVTAPITLMCAGNRRKEQNIVQKSLGFSWGAGGVSTALFTGVYLCDVLDYIRPARKAKHVIFEGCDQLPNGPYGTSQLLSWARDRRKSMMLAWAMNGLPLEPDHGFPLRLLVPGQIGGRSVKWLNRIELSENESQHHLHFHDNKVLPMPLGAERPRAEKEWWYDHRYIIREINVNSAIACPDHNEVLEIANTSPEATYTVRGYAYAGGGRRVTRVEMSLDDGNSWSLADDISYPEDLFREVAYFDHIYGDLDLTDSDTCFCWCFWSFDVPITTLKNSKAIAVRVMDESLALQPRDMYWNATGMMNNWWFRVCIHRLDGERLMFEHPTMAGTQPGGWMQRLKDAGLNPAKPNFFSTLQDQKLAKKVPKASEVSMTKDGVSRQITLEELEAHNTKEDVWFVVRGEVYEGTGFLNEHPGGPQSITLVAGEDATEDFMAIHSTDARKQLAGYHIGTLVGTVKNTNAEQEINEVGPFLSPKKWKKVILLDIEEVSKDSKIYRFKLQRPDQELGLPVGQHVYVRLRRKADHKDKAEIVEGELVQRAYTPISQQDERGFIDMLIKIYYPSAEFPQGGRMTLGFAGLAVGDIVELKGPIGEFTWLGKGKAFFHGEERSVRKIGLICGGSGITPILQVLRGILNDSSDADTAIWVLDVNRYVGDILCKEELDRLATDHSERFHIHYTLTGKPIPDEWTFSTGRINDDMLRTHLPTPSEDGLVCLCGPPLMEKTTKDALCKLGWDPKSQIFTF